MKRFVMGIVVAAVCLAAPFAWAARTDAQIVNRETWFNKVTDSMATLGQPPGEQQKILEHRKKMRRMEREESLRQKKAAAIRKQIAEQQELLMEKANAPYAR